MNNFGVDVSSNNFTVDWDSLHNQHDVNYAMIRAGLGNNTEDTRLYENVKGCRKNNIKFGLYWFSYAYNVTMAKTEANSLCDYADEIKPELPLAFDYEYDSERYSQEMGVTPTKTLRIAIAKAFIETCNKRGYSCLLYTNYDYISNRGYDQIADYYPLWLAEWNDSRESYRSCVIHQFAVRSIGNLGAFDLNYFNDVDDLNIEDKIIQYIKDVQYNGYLKLAFDVINGKYGNGDDRQNKIRAKGFDYEIVQELVNYILDSKEFICDYFIKSQWKNYKKWAEKIKDSKTDAKTIKQQMNKRGYDYEILREITKYL